MFHLVRGSVYLLVVLGASFSFLYIGLVTMFTYIVLIFDIYIYMMYVFFTYHIMCFFFPSLYTCFLLIVCNLLYFCFTLRCCNEFCLKCFRNIGCQSLSCHEFSSYKVFQEFMLGLDFIVFSKWVWVEWFDFSHMFICLLWFCHELPKGKIIRTYVNHVRNICHLELANLLTKCTLLVIG